MIARVLFVCAGVLLHGAASAEGVAQPYAGEEQREIASLSEGDVTALLAGEGWGFAKPAELNGYPGPAHVLESADTLDLDADQRAAIAAIYDEMRAEAQALGRKYVETEAALDNAFASGSIDDAALADILREAAGVRASLREVHLAAHLRTRPLLRPHQRMVYQRLRGYAGNDNHGSHGAH